MKGGLRLGQPFSLIMQPVAWSKRQGPSIRHYVNADHPTNNKAKLALAEAAHQARGHPFTLVNGIPYVASEVAKNVPKGQGVHGGLTAAERQAQRNAAYDVSISRLSQKAGGRGQGAFQGRQLSPF